MRREFRILFKYKIYLMCMVVMPCICAVFFTTLMKDGLPSRMPIGIVDNDNTSMTRKLARTLDAFQSTKIVESYASPDDAIYAMQCGEIYGFMHFPKNMTDDLLAQRQPTVSFYYSNISLSAGSMTFKDMKTMATLASAALGQATLSAKGVRPEMIKPLLQPIAIDLHSIGNPWGSYNVFLSSMLVPACFLLFIFLMTPFTFGTELKFQTSKEFMQVAGDNPIVAVIGKLLPSTLIYLIVMYGLMAYLYWYLGFPAPGGFWRMALLGILAVIGTQGVSLTIFGLCPTLRTGMSLCSLMGVLSFSMVGSAFPVFAMDAPLQALSWLFPLRHYYIIFQLCIFNTYPLSSAHWHIVALIISAFAPLLLAERIGNAMRKGIYLK